MEYRKLGNTTLKISEIGFGCMSMGTHWPEVNNLVAKALASGINFFDTADLYQHGTNEILIGKALKSRRTEVIIATKVGNVWNQDGHGWHWDASGKHIISAVEESLSRLQTDYIDLYQLHGGTIEDPIDETIEAFEKLVEVGKIRYYGISSIRPNVIREYVNRANIGSVMMQYSLLDRRPEESILNLLQENNIGVLTRGSMAQGHLINKPASTYLNHTAEELKAFQKEFHAITDSNLHRIQWSLQYVLNQPVVKSAVTGIRTQDQLEQVIRYKDLNISKDEIQKFIQLINPLTYQLHR